jgi:hypothetical protein
MVKAKDPYSRILDFLDQSRYFFFQIAPHLYSQGKVEPVPDSLLTKTNSVAFNLRANYTD